MAKNILFAAVCSCFIAACGNNANNDVVTNPDSTFDSQKNIAAAPDSSAQMPFKNIMERMMQDMHKMTMTNDPDHDFALMMKRHHEAAIEMANLEITKGSNADQQFKMAMTMHHQQGIDMAKEYLNTGTQQQQTKKVAENVIKTNSENLQKLKGA